MAGCGCPPIPASGGPCDMVTMTPGNVRWFDFLHLMNEGEPAGPRRADRHLVADCPTGVLR